MNAKFTVTRSARRATRRVCGGAAALTHLKVAAHRAERRSARVAIRHTSADFDHTPARRGVTCTDVD